jgi:putative hydrolase of the HAD superfamily
MERLRTWRFDRCGATCYGCGFGHLETQCMNVVFDVGNVLVRWSPREIMRRALVDQPDTDLWAERFFGHELWRQLNRGHFTEAEAKRRYLSTLPLTAAQIDAVFHHVKDSQEAVPGSHELLRRLHAADYPLFALTDNVHEIVAYLRTRYDFWSCLRGAVVSAEVGCLKPEPEIFHALLDTHALDAHATVFIDDVPRNVEGARTLGMHAIQFHDAGQCEQALRDLALAF